MSQMKYVDFLQKWFPLTEDGTIDFGDMTAEELAHARAVWRRQHVFQIA